MKTKSNDDSLLAQLVQEIGWTRLIKGLARYANRKEHYHRELGLKVSAHHWAVIQQKLMEIRKNPQL